MDEDTPDDKLLAAPGREDQPGSLASSRRTILTHEHQMAQLYAEQNGTAPARMLMPWSTPHEKQRLEEEHRKQQLAVEQQIRLIAERQDQLLQRIEAEQAAIAIRRQEIDDHALRLRDGRKVFVDGDRYRDETGRVLSGADEAEAHRQHETRPDASTWSEKQEIERRAAEAQKLREKIEADRDSGQGPPAAQEQRLDGYEKEFATKVNERQSQMDEGPPVAGAALPDYMGAYQVSSAPAFNDASGVIKADAPKPKDGESDAVTADAKKPPQPFGQGGPKMGG